jgi:hypothetical protein
MDNSTNYNNDYSIRLNNYIKDLCIDNSVNYTEDLQNLINIHNTTISEVCQSILTSSLLSILIKKGIITDEEFVKEFEEFFNNSKQREALESNRDRLLEYASLETDFNEDLFNTYEAMCDSIDIDLDETEDPDFSIPSIHDSPLTHHIIQHFLDNTTTDIDE